MTQKEWQRAFGNAPEDFLQRLNETLERPEETKMKKRYKFTTVLLAASLAVMLLAGAGLAAGQLGLFKMLDGAVPITPLEGAEDMVVTNLGSAQNDYVTLSVEEAVYDGQGTLVQLRLSPNDSARFALLNDMLQEYPDDVCAYEKSLIPVAAGFDEEKFLSVMKVSAEDAFVYVDGVKYINPELMTDCTLIRTDGKAWLSYDIDDALSGISDSDAQNFAVDPDNYLDHWEGETQPDGSVILWGSGFSKKPMGESIELTITCAVKPEGADEWMRLELPVTLTRADDIQRVRLEPANETEIEGFKLTEAFITFTKVRGYITLSYDWQLRGDDDMGPRFMLLDVSGNEINTGDGYGDWTNAAVGEWGSLSETSEMQSQDTLPERIDIVVRPIGEDTVLGTISCNLITE